MRWIAQNVTVRAQEASTGRDLGEITLQVTGNRDIQCLPEEEFWGASDTRERLVQPPSADDITDLIDSYVNS